MRMDRARSLRIGIIAGEESGELLAVDLIRELEERSGRKIELIGVGGTLLAERGLRSMFDPQEIALVGIGAVVGRLPKLLARISSTARKLSAADLDCLLTVDVPDFALRVARRFHEACPGVPVVHYVCPSVWAWRPKRAAAMKQFIDHVLCLLPFEPDALQRLNGPPGTYVGHRLVHDAALASAFESRRERGGAGGKRPTLLLLPGSRRSEVSRLLPDFGETLVALEARGSHFDLVLPTVPHVEGLVRSGIAEWKRKPLVLTGADEKRAAMADANAALIASGTVSLELALAGVPHVSCYRLDAVSRPFKHLIRSWSANLPNLISDRPVIAEFYDDAIRAENLARQIESLAADTELRRWQMTGFEEVRRRMETSRPAAEIAADVVLDLIKRRGRPA